MTTSTSPSPHAAAHLRVDGVSKSFGARRVLTDVSFTVSRDRAGLIGENGSGKTTLLRIIAGLTTPDGGTVTTALPGGVMPRIGLLRQEPPFAPSATITEALESAVAPVRAAAHAVERAGLALAASPEGPWAATAYAAALETAERVGAWDVDARIAAVVAGLGLSTLAGDRPTRELSGGQRSRLSLAWLLLSTPEVLLLDEPTNHLDDDAAAYLTTLLEDWRGPVLTASHDRAFLDDVMTTLIDLDPAPLPQSVAGPLVADGDGTGIGVVRFTGTYTGYVHARLDARERWDRRYRDEQAELKRLRATVADSHLVGHEDWTPRSEGRASLKFYSDRNAKAVSRRVDDATSRLLSLEDRQIRRPPRELRFQGLTAAGAPSTPEGALPVLTAAEAAVHGRLAVTSLVLGAGEKWLVTGPNGSGKSTLLSLLAGDLSPTSGTVGAAPSLRIGLLAQDVDLPDPRGRGPGRTARQAYDDAVGPACEEIPLRTFGLVHPRDENRPVAVLSVGQQRRLALAVLLASPPDVLLLDEPTNHFSLLLATRLEALIPGYPGTVVVASHDRWLRRTWRGRRLELTADDAMG
ncbi:ABC-F family ATP-binding cassette domain-containing protein [Arthrobacter antioxidans]|uniref:ABC-F family ATP-binding cassette domain-containing protein n=1 Tax=Arthrobacter antioxidans TaxID=2895818 RepID=UPI0020005168|nr:ABC-F family ATP-binding cassette domain-containing protein [Arthrobacter antioxidans]